MARLGRSFPNQIRRPMPLLSVAASPILLVHNFETGQTSGTAVTTGNSVATGQTAFDSIVNAPTYDNTHVHNGSLALKASPSAQLQQNVVWSTSAFGGVTPSQ